MNVAFNCKEGLVFVAIFSLHQISIYLPFLLFPYVHFPFLNVVYCVTDICSCTYSVDCVCECFTDCSCSGVSTCCCVYIQYCSCICLTASFSFHAL